MAASMDYIDRSAAKAKKVVWKLRLLQYELALDMERREAAMDDEEKDRFSAAINAMSQADELICDLFCDLFDPE